MQKSSLADTLKRIGFVVHDPLRAPVKGAGKGLVLVERDGLAYLSPPSEVRPGDMVRQVAARGVTRQDLAAYAAARDEENLADDLGAAPFEPGLLLYTGRRLTPVRSLQELPVPRPARLLLVVHGGHSNARHVWDSFQQRRPKSFLAEWSSAYRTILFFTHPTLTEDPCQNAASLVRAFTAFIAAAGGGAPEIDILCHSRGGLVTRAFLELEPEPALKVQTEFLRARVQNVCFVATPNGGMNLFHPSAYLKASQYLSLVGALTHVDVAANLALTLQLGAAEFSDPESAVPGVACLCPGSPFLQRLLSAGRRPAHVRYFAVGSNYEPARLPRLPKDLLFDFLIRTDNDLTVETTSPMGQVTVRETHGKTFGKWLPLEQALVYGHGGARRQLHSRYAGRLTAVEGRAPSHSEYFHDARFGAWFRQHILPP